MVMREAKVIGGIAVAALAVILGWPVATCEIADYEFRDDLHDTAVQNGAKIGLTAPASDADLRSEVIRIARSHGIQLESDQITVKRSAAPETTDVPAIFLAADYEANINLPGYSFALHFNPSSGK